MTKEDMQPAKKYMKPILIILLMIAVFSVHAFGQTGETELYAELKTVDTELNVACRQLKTKLSASGKAAFDTAQKDWLKFRESNCVFISRSATEGGVLSNKMKISCAIEMTWKRIQRIHETEKDISAP